MLDVVEDKQFSKKLRKSMNKVNPQEKNDIQDNLDSVIDGFFNSS